MIRRMSQQHILLFSSLILLGAVPFLVICNRNIQSLRILHESQDSPTTYSDLTDHRLTIYQLILNDIKKGNLDKLNETVIPALKLNYPLITSLYGKLLVIEGDFSGGLKIWKQLGDLISILNAGELAEDRKQYQKALSAYQVAHKLDPDDSEIHYKLARVLMKLGNRAEADAWYQSAIMLNPKKEWNFERARNAQISGNYDQALDIYLKIIEDSPEFPESYFEIALIYSSLTCTGESISAIEHAINLANPPKVKYFIRAGNIYKQFGDTSKAIAAYESALELDPQSVIAKKRLEQLMDH